MSDPETPGPIKTYRGHPKFTVDEIEKALRKTGGLKSRAASALGAATGGRRTITRGALAKRIDTTPRLQKALVDIEESIKDLAEDRLIKNIRAGRERSVLWYLEHKGHDRGYMRQIGLNGGINPDGSVIPLAGSPTVIISIPDNGRDPQLVAIDATPQRQISSSNGSHSGTSHNANGSADGEDC